MKKEGGVKETFQKRKACFHLSCRSKYNFTKLKRKGAALSSGNEDSNENEQSRKFTRTESEVRFKTFDENESCCFLSSESAPAKELRNASTSQLDERLENCALLLQDSKLLAKLSTGDVNSQELKYHPGCLTRLYRRAKPKLDCGEPEEDQMRNGLVFAELTELYMQEVRDTSSGLSVFRLADLAKLYQKRLQEYGTGPGRVHSGRLKTKLLAHFPDLQAYASGRDILLTFTDDMNSTFKEAYTESWDDEAVHLAKAARIVRRDMFHLQTEFSGPYDEHCQYSSIPETLLALMQMILQGPSADTAKREKCQASLSLAQLANFNDRG